MTNAIGDAAMQLALGYAWGWQDALKAHGVKRDSNEAHHFATAYAALVQAYAAGGVTSKQPVQDAWTEWTTHRQLTYQHRDGWRAFRPVTDRRTSTVVQAADIERPEYRH